MTQSFRFVANGHTYTFPETISAFRDNFTNVLPSAVRLPGIVGGYRSIGSRRSPRELGRIDVQFYLEAANASQMAALRDEANAMAGWGEGFLYYTPEGGDSERWTIAEVNNLSAPQNADDGTQTLQRVEAVFRANDPHWYANGTEGSATALSATGTSTDLTVTVAQGNTFTKPRLVLTVPSGQTAQNPVLTRRVNGVAVESLSYSGTLTDSDTLVINTRTLAVLLNGADDFADLTYTYAGYLDLEPGENTIRVAMDGASDALDVAFHSYYRWVGS